jgi:hypothetical protein
MTVPLHTEPSFVRRRQSISCRRQSSALQGGTLPGKVPSPNVTSDCNAVSKSDTLFTAFPVELRVEVFLQFCGPFSAVSSGDGPLVLLQVCRAWRQLALQTPQLWSSFALNIGPRLTGPAERELLVAKISGWISRSRSLPLSLRLHYKPDRSTANPTFDPTFTDLIHCLLATSARWRNVALSAPSTSLVPLLTAAPDSFPSLRSFALETTGPWSRPFALKDFGINWARVTDVDLFIVPIPSLNECLHILKEGVNLTRCTMNATCVYSPSSPQRITLPQLEHLRLTLYGSTTSILAREQPASHFLEFLSALSLPGLQSLQISWNALGDPDQGYYWSNWFSRFLHFLEPLGDHLKSLHLAHLPFHGAQVVRCLRVLPSLRHLDLRIPQGDREHDFIDDAFLNALADESGSATLLPCLQSIRLESYGQSFKNPALLGFIASRWKYQPEQSRSNGQLVCFELVSPKRRTEYRTLQLKDWKEGRLDVAAELKSEYTMLTALSSFLNTDSYGEIGCFLNRNLPIPVIPLVF